MFKNKKVLVTGGTGLLGREVVKKLVKLGAIVTSISLDEDNFEKSWNVNHIKGDLRDSQVCFNIVKNQQFVFHIAGIKGSPILVKEKPYVFFTNFIQMNTNMIAAMNSSDDMEWGLYTSTVGTYGPSDEFFEDKLWDDFPSKNDWFAGWAKRMGELQIDAYEQQTGIRKISIIKPVNIYGSFDNFDLKTSTLVPSLVRKVYESTESVEIWGKGDATRDIIHASDCARAAIMIVEQKVKDPVNVGLGMSVSILDVINTIIKVSGKKLKVTHDYTKPTGDGARIANVNRLKSTGFKPEKTLEEGFKETYDWYQNNIDYAGRYNAFINNSDYTTKN
jgi:GDP-L-fucose synthase